MPPRTAPAYQKVSVRNATTELLFSLLMGIAPIVSTGLPVYWTIQRVRANTTESALLLVFMAAGVLTSRSTSTGSQKWESRDA